MEAENELPMLAGIAAILRWAEELLNIINGPLLLFGAGVALVDLLTDGALTISLPILLYGWAVSQALGIDTQLLGCFARARNVKGWARWGWLALGLILGYAAWQAGYVFAVQQAQHISEVAALAQLHMDPSLWLGWRAFLAVGLVALSGWTRYKKPAPVAISLDDERRKIQEELELAPLREQLRLRQVGGWRAIAQAALQGQQTAQASEPTNDAPAPAEASQGAHTAPQNGQEAAAADESPIPDAAETNSDDDHPRPPTGGGSPLASKPTTGSSASSKSSGGATITPLRKGMGRKPRQDRRTAARANARSGQRGTAEARVRGLLSANPSITFDDLVRKARVSPSTASKYRALWEQESAQQAAQ